jgi:hypothetical protein
MTVLCYLGAALCALWGIAHVIPTRQVVDAFGDISADNRKIITMEWLAEGAMLMFIGALVIVSTAINHNSDVARAAYALSAAGLGSLTVVSLFTGFKVKALPFKLCPPIFTIAAVLILAGGFA